MLGEEGRAILDFERDWWKLPGAKDQSIEFALGLSSAVYYERLLQVVEDPAALGYDPLTVKRVRLLIEESGEGEVVR